MVATITELQKTRRVRLCLFKVFEGICIIFYTEWWRCFVLSWNINIGTVLIRKKLAGKAIFEAIFPADETAVRRFLVTWNTNPCLHVSQYLCQPDFWLCCNSLSIVVCQHPTLRYTAMEKQKYKSFAPVCLQLNENGHHEEPLPQQCISTMGLHQQFHVQREWPKNKCNRLYHELKHPSTYAFPLS